MTAEPYDPVAQGQRDSRRYWDARAAERVAAGLPPTVDAELGRRPRYFVAGSPIEQHWMQKAVDLDLVKPGMNRSAWRRLAYRLASNDAARKLAAPDHAAPPHADDDDALALAHHQREVALWGARAERDDRIAAEHRRFKEEAEAALTALMRKLGMIS